MVLIQSQKYRFIVDDLGFSEDIALSIVDGSRFTMKRDILFLLLVAKVMPLLFHRIFESLGVSVLFPSWTHQYFPFERPSDVECIEDDAFNHCQIAQFHIPVDLSMLTVMLLIM